MALDSTRFILPVGQCYDTYIKKVNLFLSGNYNEKHNEHMWALLKMSVAENWLENIS